MRRFDNFRRSRNEQDKLLAKICIYAFILLAALILFEKGHRQSAKYRQQHCQGN